MQDVASKTVSENLVLSSTIVDSIFEANLKHDSLWYTELTLDESLSLGVSEEQYRSFVKEMNAANEILRDAYRLGANVYFSEPNEPNPSTKSFEPEFHATAMIDGNSYNNSTFVSFTCKSNTVIMIVNASFDFVSLIINGDMYLGWSGHRFSVSHKDGADSSGNYQWNLYIRSTVTIVAPEIMRFTFANPGA